jgi:hypothetical protein
MEPKYYKKNNKELKKSSSYELLVKNGIQKLILKYIINSNIIFKES